MGQDRKYSEDNIHLALRTVKSYINTWEEVEKENLRKDVERLGASKESDRNYVELESQKAQDEEDKYVEDRVNINEALEDEDDKERETKRLRMEYVARQLTGYFAENDDKADEDKEGEPDDKKAKKPAKKREKKGDPKDEEKKKEMELQAAEEAENQRKLLTKFKEDFLKLKEYKVVKFPRVFQAVFYLLGYNRE